MACFFEENMENNDLLSDAFRSFARQVEFLRLHLQYLDAERKEYLQQDQQKRQQIMASLQSLVEEYRSWKRERSLVADD
jgi:hypothetical protein